MDGSPSVALWETRPLWRLNRLWVFPSRVMPVVVDRESWFTGFTHFCGCNTCSRYDCVIFLDINESICWQACRRRMSSLALKIRVPADWKSDVVVNSHLGGRPNTITVSTLQHFLGMDHIRWVCISWFTAVNTLASFSALAHNIRKSFEVLAF